MNKFVLAAALVVCCSGVMAENRNAYLEAYAGGAQYFWDDERKLDSSTSLEIGLEIPVGDRLSFETWLSDFTAEQEFTKLESDGRRYSLGALVHLSDGDVRHFVSLGGSHLEFENAASQTTDESQVQLGLGMKKYFDGNWVWRGEVLAMNSLDHQLVDVVARLTVGYAFGRTIGEPEPIPVPVVRQPKPKPKPKPKPAAPPEFPQPPPPDSDKDGVIDLKDECPDTNPAFKVDEVGCAIMLIETVSIQMHVAFETNSAVLRPQFDGELKKVADFMAQFAGTSVTVEGHTDGTGSNAYNKALSDRRANSVRDALITRFGLAEDRISATGFGEEQPIASNDTKEGREQNRRVVAVIESTLERPAERE